MPLLYEGGLETQFDEVWVASCPERTQIARMASRDRFTPAEARMRLASQMPLAEKRRRATIVIETDRPLEAIRESLHQILDARSWTPLAHS